MSARTQLGRLARALIENTTPFVSGEELRQRVRACGVAPANTRQFYQRLGELVKEGLLEEHRVPVGYGLNRVLVRRYRRTAKGRAAVRSTFKENLK